MAKRLIQKKEETLNEYEWTVTLINRMSRQIGYTYDILGCFVEEFTDFKKKRISQLTDDELAGFLEFYKNVYEQERPNLIRAINYGCAPGKHPLELSDLIASMPSKTSN